MAEFPQIIDKFNLIELNKSKSEVDDFNSIKI